MLTPILAFAIATCGCGSAFGDPAPPRVGDDEIDAAALDGSQRDEPAALERLTVEVVRTYPHDPGAYTEGLLYADGELLESTGLRGTSQLRRVALESGEVLHAVDLEPDVFGEGIALHAGQIVQLSWDSERALIWDAQSLMRTGEYSYGGSGWGLCHDGRQFVMSSGTDELQLRDSETFELTEVVKVHLEEIPIRFLRLNELECAGGEVYANVFQYREIVRISLRDGKVTGWIDTRNLLRHPDVPENASSAALGLNGIAYVPERGHFLLTGKYWPRIFEVRLIPDDLFR